MNWFKKIEEDPLAEQIRNAGSRLTALDLWAESVDKQFSALERRLNSCESNISIRSESSLQEAYNAYKALQAKVDALELWKSQIMQLLTEPNAQGKTKLSRFGNSVRKRF